MKKWKQNTKSSYSTILCTDSLCIFMFPFCVNRLKQMSHSNCGGRLHSYFLCLYIEVWYLNLFWQFEQNHHIWPAITSLKYNAEMVTYSQTLWNQTSTDNPPNLDTDTKRVTLLKSRNTKQYTEGTFESCKYLRDYSEQKLLVNSHPHPLNPLLPNL